MSNSVCRIALIEPSPLIQLGLKTLFENSPRFKIVLTQPDLTNISEKITYHQVNLAIINPQVVEFNKRHTIKSNFGDTKLVALLYTYVDGATQHQFHGLIDICDEPVKIVQTLEMVLNITTRESVSTENEDLSEREKEILIAVAKGLMNKEIAALCNLSIHTVISHRKNISRKTGIKSVSGFVVYALLNNLLEEHEIQ